MPGQPGLDEMSQLPSSAHQLLTNLTPITIDGQTVYIAQVRSDSNYALASVGNIASITPTSCPVSVGAPVQATQMNIQSSMSNVMTIPNTGVTTSGGMFAMGLPGGNMTTTQKQEPLPSPSPAGYPRSFNLQGHKVRLQSLYNSTICLYFIHDFILNLVCHHMSYRNFGF